MTEQTLSFLVETCTSILRSLLTSLERLSCQVVAYKFQLINALKLIGMAVTDKDLPTTSSIQLEVHVSILGTHSDSSSEQLSSEQRLQLVIGFGLLCG